MTVRVALLNDYELIVAGLRNMLLPFDEIEVVEMHVGTVEIDAAVDVALFDTYGRVGMPWQAVERLVSQPEVQHTVVFTFDFAHALVERALAMGVHGYLWKGLQPAVLAESIQRVAKGSIVVSEPESHARVADRSYRWPFDDQGLSARESEVLALLSEGLTNQQIADGLYLNVETIRSHLKQVYSKLGVHTRSQATAMALRGDAFRRR